MICRVVQFPKALSGSSNKLLGSAALLVSEDGDVFLDLLGALGTVFAAVEAKMSSIPDKEIDNAWSKQSYIFINQKWKLKRHFSLPLTHVIVKDGLSLPLWFGLVFWLCGVRQVSKNIKVVVKQVDINCSFLLFLNFRQRGCNILKNLKKQ